KRIYVGCRRKLSIFKLLGAHICGGAKELVHANGAGCGIYVSVHAECQSKVRYHYPDTVRVFGWHKKYVSRFEVSVENSDFVSSLQPGSHLQNNRKRLIGTHFSGTLEPLCESLAS